MTAAVPSPRAPEPLQFSIAGTVDTWDSFGRWLRIGARTV
jgi:hypothetical protein